MKLFVKVVEMRLKLIVSSQDAIIKSNEIMYYVNLMPHFILGTVAKGSKTTFYFCI